MKELIDSAKRWRDAKDERYLGSTQDALSMANYILANVQEDGEEKVDEAWLRTTHAVAYESNGEWKLRDNTGYWYFDADGAFVWHHVGNVTAIITTRTQFRALMVGLGIDKSSK